MSSLSMSSFGTNAKSYAYSGPDVPLTATRKPNFSASDSSERTSRTFTDASSDISSIDKDSPNLVVDKAYTTSSSNSQYYSTEAIDFLYGLKLRYR